MCWQIYGAMYFFVEFIGYFVGKYDFSAQFIESGRFWFMETNVYCWFLYSSSMKRWWLRRKDLADFTFTCQNSALKLVRKIDLKVTREI